VPAHDEQAVIGRCLDCLLAGAEPGEFDVVVVANGCTDATAEIARGYAGVRVLETGTAGKANALTLGDAACRTFPRVYLDADVEFAAESLRRLVAAVTASGALAGAPTPSFDVAGATGFTRRVHRVHEALMVSRRALAGAGAYLLTEDGHARVFPLPDVLSDDGYVDRSFGPAERVVATDAPCVVRIAPTIRATVRRRIRLREGSRQLDALAVRRPTPPLGLRDVAEIVRRGRATHADALCYLWLVAAEKAARRLRRAGGRTVPWGTDAQSRRSPDAASTT
jgi:glycosyltransferase involved in cell wall biosynthesis